jgi:hypothetical protein
MSLMREISPERPFRLVEVDMTAGLESAERRRGGDRRASDRSAEPVVVGRTLTTG